jgi:hypothetical protein
MATCPCYIILLHLVTCILLHTFSNYPLGRPSVWTRVKFPTFRRRIYFLHQGTVISNASLRCWHSYPEARNHQLHQLLACSRHVGFKS